MTDEPLPVSRASSGSVLSPPELIARLKEYTHHKEGCAWWNHYGHSCLSCDCTCGLDALLALVSPEARQETEKEEACQLNRAETWCLTHHCYPRTCAKLKAGA